jgi:hypothetical protein
MKNFPLPSFFKIRLAALIIGFLVVCFFLGAAKHVFAAIDFSQYDCYLITSSQSNYSSIPRVNTTGTHSFIGSSIVNYEEGDIYAGPATSRTYTQYIQPANLTAYWIGWRKYDQQWVVIKSDTMTSGLIAWGDIDLSYVNLWGCGSATCAPLIGKTCGDFTPSCPENGTSGGTMISEGMFVQGPWCEDNCELVRDSREDSFDMSSKSPEDGKWYTYTPVKFTGNSCSGDEVPPSPNPPDCSKFLEQCEAACRGADQSQSWCDATSRNCSCDLAPPYPIVDPGDGGGPRPDQDKDGNPSDQDNDNDGDGTDNGGDPDVDGDGTDNGGDGDVDGDGTGNGGDNGSWNPSQGSPGGGGADGDVDGDGETNCTDPDIDGDGMENENDTDMDGDGLPNEFDLNPTGCVDGVDEGCVDDPNTPEDECCVDDPRTPEDECGTNNTGECVDDPNTTQDECEEYSPIGGGSPGEAYTPGEFNIGDRLNTFFSRIRQTGVFALPNDFFNAPPTGGSPVFTFEFGSYGTRTVDLSDMSQPLLILRTIVLIAFCFVCLRVVILKR